MKAYIDCGAYKGTTLLWFRSNPNYGPAFKCFAFECNPSLLKINYGDDVTTIRAAVWTTDGELRFYRNAKTPNIQGNSVYKEKKTGQLDKKHPIIVPCIDFSAWLKKNFKLDDFVIVKMNIEGSEYDVLEKCFVDGSIVLIDELHIQWHASKIPGLNDRHRSIKAKLEQLKSIKVYDGYGHLRAAK